MRNQCFILGLLLQGVIDSPGSPSPLQAVGLLGRFAPAPCPLTAVDIGLHGHSKAFVSALVIFREQGKNSG